MGGERLAKAFVVLPNTGVYLSDQGCAFAKRTLFDATIMIPGSFDSACSNVEQYAERTATVFNSGAAAEERPRYRQ